MTKFERLFRLYDVSFQSEIKGDEYFVLVKFRNDLKFEAKHQISLETSIRALFDGVSVENFLDNYYRELSYLQLKKLEATEFLKTLPRYHSKLLLRHLNT